MVLCTNQEALRKQFSFKLSKSIIKPRQKNLKMLIKRSPFMVTVHGVKRQGHWPLLRSRGLWPFLSSRLEFPPLFISDMAAGKAVAKAISARVLCFPLDLLGMQPTHPLDAFHVAWSSAQKHSVFWLGSLLLLSDLAAEKRKGAKMAISARVPCFPLDFSWIATGSSSKWFSSWLIACRKTFFDSAAGGSLLFGLCWLVGEF